MSAPPLTGSGALRSRPVTRRASSRRVSEKVGYDLLVFGPVCLAFARPPIGGPGWPPAEPAHGHRRRRDDGQARGTHRSVALRASG
ncbi:protein of unknown function [Blastococcus saxobsidens DD2]|uniref:Uncharacterized protein n=1 Tax=Blastococcus saxobsidens (strain DD2) TaxID=1146883 RepID=H6RR35_BLASD|nr:protein of unknown function [Blastococcus saxobsidens DD2]